jgi:aminoglycoside/choline kinase family phosphotransferase
LTRIELLENWLATVYKGAPVSIEPASEDASFRRYFRVNGAQGSRIVMDAPPPNEDCQPYVHVARLFRASGVNVPEILDQDLDSGFLLLTDFGHTTYLSALTADNASRLYGEALESLLRIQLASQPGLLPDYDTSLLLREMQLFPEWYVGRHLKHELTHDQSQTLTQQFDLVLKNVLSQKQVYVHRDYHSRNLMVTVPNPGILDFQDAVYGPLSYDLVSLLKDAYICWEEEQTLDWLIRYWEKARASGLPVSTDFAGFYRDYEWMGVQRHLKVLGIFARLCYRDGKESYLKDMPLVLHYLRRTCERYNELSSLSRLLDDLEPISARPPGCTF